VELAGEEPGMGRNLDHLHQSVRDRTPRDPQTGVHQPLGLVHYIADGPANQIAPHGRNDAKGAAMVTAFRDFQIGIMSWRQLDALGWNQIGERIVPFFLWHKLVNSPHYFLIGMRT
jgi:hypothetical protein